MESKYFLRFIFFKKVYFIGERFEFKFSCRNAKFKEEFKIFKFIEFCGYCI